MEYNANTKRKMLFLAHSNRSFSKIHCIMGKIIKPHVHFKILCVFINMYRLKYLEGQLPES